MRPEWGYDYSDLESADRKGIDANECLNEPDDMDAYKRYIEVLRNLRGEND